jgi:tRNA pseudouridine55 synthase
MEIRPPRPQAPAIPTTEAAGLLLVDKPAGITSHDVVARVRRAVGTRRVGHTGTLDPFATGLLVVLVGRATRLVSYVPGEPKVYDAVIAFGAETETDDRTGPVSRTAEAPEDAAIDRAAARLTGRIEQLPPAYSAKQVGGVRAYAAARRGAPLALAPSAVTVFEWKLGGRAGDRLSARVTCSSGTYIRALARDLGREAGSAAHLESLRRVASGPFTVDSADSIDDLDAGRFTLIPMLEAVSGLPVQAVDDAELARSAHGNPVPARVAGDRVALVHGEQLAAIAVRSQDALHPKVVLIDR